MAIQFESGKIVIQADADAWGPFVFDLEDAMPYGRTVASATVASYLGRVKPDASDTLDSETVTTAELIDSSVMATDYKLWLYFNRPTTAAWINVKHTIVITFTLDAAGGGGTHSTFFYAVEVI